MDRNEALELVRQHVRKENNVKHMIAVGAVMRETAVRLGEDAERWDLVGILHDIDFEICTGIENHCLRAKEILRDKVDDEIVDAIMAHNFEHTHVQPDTVMKKALIASDAVSGLVIACALVMPTKKLAEVRPETVIKKFGNRDFAKGAYRERILFCEQIGIPRDAFLSTALDGMRKVSSELGL
jgi:predicted hydrolase (HD superfamily)